MITPAHHAELWRLLVEHAEAVETANGEVGAALRTGDESAFTVASMRLERASRALYAFTRRAAAEPPPAADGTGEPAQQPDDLRARYCPGISIDCLAGGPECACMTATAEQRASIRAALTARDERIAALERTESILRSVADASSDGGIEEIVALVDVDIARRAAEWERMADEIAAANVEATARIAALEALVSLPECDHAKPCTCGSGGHPRKCKRHPNAYRHHIAELNAIGSVEDGEAEARLTEAIEETLALRERVAALEADLADAIAKGIGWQEQCRAERAAFEPTHLLLMDTAHPLESLHDAAKRAKERIAALEAGLRDAADDLADHERWWRTVDEIAKADDALASIRAARALADAGKVGT